MDSSRYIKTFTKLWAKLVWVLLVSSCLSPIDFPTERSGGQLVVSGQISPLTDQNVIQLGITASTDQLPFTLSGAFITLLDDIGGSHLYNEDPAFPGYYRLADFAGVPGRTYHIVINLPDGRTYESAPEKMPEGAGQLTTSYKIQPEEYTDPEGIISTRQFMKIYTSTILPSSKPRYMKWSVEEVFLLSPTDFPDPFGNIPPPCFISQNADPQRITLLNDTELNIDGVDELLVASRIIDWTFNERHYFTTIQSSLTTEAYEYWRKVNILSNQVGSIFDTPPAQIRGNIYKVGNQSDNVLGYFQASNQTFDRFYLVSYDIPFPLIESCTYSPDKYEYKSRCLDCLSVRNSSYERPDWF